MNGVAVQRRADEDPGLQDPSAAAADSSAEDVARPGLVLRGVHAVRLWLARVLS